MGLWENFPLELLVRISFPCPWEWCLLFALNSLDVLSEHSLHLRCSQIWWSVAYRPFSMSTKLYLSIFIRIYLSINLSIAAMPPISRGLLGHLREGWGGVNSHLTFYFYYFNFRVGFKGEFSWKGEGTLLKNSYKPSHDLWEATLKMTIIGSVVSEILWYTQTRMTRRHLVTFI